MKNQRQPSGSQFYPRSRMPSLRKKPRERFASPHMKKLLSEFKKTQAYMRQCIMRNRNNSANRRENYVAKKACMHRSKAFDSSKMVNAKDKQDKARALQTRQITQEDSNFRLSNTFTVNGNLVPMTKSARKSNSALTPSLKDLNQPITPRLDSDLVSSSKNLKQCKPSISRDGFSSKEEHVPLMSKNDSNATLGCSNKSRPLEAKEGSIHNSSNIIRSNSRPNRLKSVVGLVLKENNVDASNQCNNVLGSRLKGRSNHDEEMIVVGKGSIEILKSLKSKQTVATSKGSNFSMEQELLVSSKDSSNKDKKCQDEVMVDKEKEKGHASVASIERTLSGKVHIMCDDDHHKQGDILKAKEAPNSSSTLKGNQVMQDLRSNSWNNSFPIFGKVLSSHQRVVASCMDDNMEWNGDPSDGCFQLDGRNRNTKFAEGGKTDDVELKRKRIEPLPEEQLMTHVDDDSEEAENCRPMNKRRRYREINEDEEVDLNPIGIEDDTAGLTSQTVILKDHHPNVSMPFVSESVKQQRYNYSQPIDEPIWSGIFKIGSKEYVSLAAHLSIKSCEKVWTLSRSLLPVVEVTKLSRSEVWPRIWEASRPTDDSIGLYFFPYKMRPDEHLDQLVKEVIENDMVLRAVIGEAEMLIFPSILLPEPYQTFQRKHYLWGVFKRRNDMVAVVEEHHGTGHHAQEEEMEKQHASHQQDEVQCEESDQETLMNRVMRLKKQRLVGKHRGVDQQDEVQCEESDQELPMNRAMLLKKQQLMGTCRGVEKEGVEASTPQVEASCVPWPNMDTELEAPEEANRQEVDKELTPSLAGPNAPRLDERNTEASSAPTRPATTSDHGQTDSSLRVPPGKMFAFVVRQTPRLEQLVQEMEREGALVVAMQGEMIGSGFGQATAVQ